MQRLQCILYFTLFRYLISFNVGILNPPYQTAKAQISFVNNESFAVHFVFSACIIQNMIVFILRATHSARFFL